MVTSDLYYLTALENKSTLYSEELEYDSSQLRKLLP